MVPRQDILSHIDEECEMKEILCSFCHETTTKRNYNKHLQQCEEYEIECTFVSFGCKEKMKRKLLNQHLKNNEMNHLKMKVEIIYNH